MSKGLQIGDLLFSKQKKYHSYSYKVLYKGNQVQ